MKMISAIGCAKFSHRSVPTSTSGVCAEGGMSDEDRVDRILDRILAAIKPDQGNDGFVHIFNALTQAISFQMALLCPDCRRRLARKLKSHIPMMMTNAAQLAKEAQKEHGVQHLH